MDMHVVYLQFKVDVLIRPEAAHLLLHPVFQEKSPDNWKDFQEKLCTVKTMLFGNETRRPSAIVARLRAVPLDAFRGQIAQFFPTLCSLVIGFDVFDKSIPLTEDIVDVMQRAVYGDDVERELLAVSCVLQCLQIRTRILEDLHPLKSMLESIHALLGADE
ncbi:MAG: hypothetical protein LBC42_02855 [Puniceicoccales bacterium]|nr:hypothetical protein [Puniceicoccales bacterium]